MKFSDLKKLVGTGAEVVVATHDGCPLKGRVYDFRGDVVSIGSWEVYAFQVKKIIPYIA
jgi:hypothetical protein